MIVFYFGLLSIVSAASFKNIIVLFHGTCPQGWNQLEYNNEFIRIAGKNLTSGQRGGSNEVKIQIDNVPPHFHSTGTAGFYHKYGGGQFHDHHQAPGGNYELWFDGYTSTVGGGKPLNIIPSFMAFTLCQLKNDLQFYVTQKDDSKVTIQLDKVSVGFAIATLVVAALTVIFAAIEVIIKIYKLCTEPKPKANDQNNNNNQNKNKNQMAMANLNKNTHKNSGSNKKKYLDINQNKNYQNSESDTIQSIRRS